MYVGLQLLRGLAAMLVVIYHAGLLVQDRFPELGSRFLLPSGAGGVDIFFPISGFVMYVSSRALIDRPGGWRVFAARRLMRIVPLYWIATTLKLVIVLAIPALAHTRIMGWNTVASYLFIFAYNSDGLSSPVLPAGWTLNFEMFFYALFALALFVKKPLLPCITALLLAATAGSVFSMPGTPLWVLDPLILEFGAGVWIAHLTVNGLPSTRALGMKTFVTSLAALIGTCALPSEFVEHWRVLFWGIPGALLVLSAVSLERWFAQRNWRFARMLGDASYSIYLAHAFPLAMLGVLAGHAGLHGIIGGAATFALAVAGGVATGIVVYRFVERPITEALLAWHKARQAVPAVKAQAAPGYAAQQVS